MKQTTRRSGLSIMRSLIVLVKPLTGVMLLGIFLGVIGFLCAIFLTITGGYGIIYGLYTLLNNGFTSAPDISKVIFISLIVMAVARSILHYGEQ